MKSQRKSTTPMDAIFHAHAPTISLASSFSPSRARRGIRETPQTLVKLPLGMDEWDGQSTILRIMNFRWKMSQSHSNDQYSYL